MVEKKLLIIEDDPKFRRVVKNAFKGKNYRGPHYEFLETGSIRDGVGALDKNPGIQIILLDLDLPDGSGKDFLEQIRDRASRVRVIVLTAHEEHLDYQKAMDFSVFNYLPKAASSFTQSIRFSVDQAFKDIEREQLKDKNQILIEIQKRINSDIQESAAGQNTLDALNDVLNLICQSVRDLVGVHTCHIRLYNLRKGDFDLAAFDGPNDGVRTVFRSPRRKDELFSGKVAMTKATMLFPDLQNDDEFKAFKEQSLKRIELMHNGSVLKEAQDYFNSIQSAFIAPITTRMFADEIDAVFNVSGDSVDFFSEDKQEVIKEFVTQATIAITKAWQKQRKQESHQDYKGISKVLEDISKELGGEDVKNQIYDIAIKGISDIIKPETVSIYLHNKTTRLLDNEAEFRGLNRVEPRKEGHPPDEGLTGYVYSNGKPLRIPNLQEGNRSRPQDHKNFSKDLEIDYVGDIPSGRVDHYLGVPMIIGDEVIGAIQLLNKKSGYYKDPQTDSERWLLERGFSDDCENALGIAASHLAVAIKNAELLEERDRRIRQLDTLKDVGRYTSAETPLDQLLYRIIETAAKDVQAEVCLLFLLDESKSKVALRQRYGIPKEGLEEAEYAIGEGLTGRVAQTGESKLQKAETPRGKYDTVIENHLRKVYGEDTKIESLMAVPIRFEREILGVIKAINKKGIDGQYNEEDLGFFETYAGYVGVAIENARRHESAVEKLATALATAESNSTLSNLVASVAHEINNTHGLIPINIDDLRKALPETLDRDTAGLLDEIEELAMQMVYYSNEIGGYSIGKMGEQERLNINDVVNRALQQIPEFRKPTNFANISVVPKLAESALVCLVHENPLIRTIRNVIINAYQALDGKAEGQIVIATRVDNPAGMAMIEISDTGCGIKPQYAEKIFEPEFTTKPGKGSGIGLWLAKRHLDSIGGSITFSSKVGQGTTFVLGIPLIPRMICHSST